MIFFTLTLWPAAFFVWFVIGFNDGDQEAVQSLNGVITVIATGASP